MKLTQLKQFTSETIDQKLAGKMCAILGIESAWAWGDRSFTIKDEWYGVSKNYGTSSTQHASHWNDPNHVDPIYDRTHHGVPLQ